MSDIARVLIVPLDDGTYRDVTHTEFAEALTVEQRRSAIADQIIALEKELESITCEDGVHVCYDQAGDPYNLRTCIKCGGVWLLSQTLT